MELHRRCSRSNIPALVMLLLQLSVLLSGAAAGAVAKPETLVDEKEPRAEPGPLDLEKFDWDGDTYLKVCITKGSNLLPSASALSQVNLLHKVGGVQSESNYLGTIDDAELECASFNTTSIYPFTINDAITYVLVVVDNDGVKQAGEATFTGPAELPSSGGSTVTCAMGGATQTFNRLDSDEDAVCLDEVGFDSLAGDVCYIVADPNPDDGCVTPPDSVPATITVCQPPTTYEPINPLPDLTVALIYNDELSKEFYFTSTLAGVTIWETIVLNDDMISYTVYRSDTPTDIPPNKVLYNMCVVALSDVSTAVGAGDGSIQDIDLGLYNTGTMLEFGLVNLNVPDFTYTVTAENTGVLPNEYGPLALDCKGVTEGLLCFGFLGVNADTSGTMTVVYAADNTNAITIPYEPPVLGEAFII